jgi:hypothetical protein
VIPPIPFPFTAVVKAPALGHSPVMRFYILPTDEDKTTCINFDHVAYVCLCAKTIELYFIGVESPMVITKSPTTLALVAKGMDLSDNSKDLVNTL